MQRFFERHNITLLHHSINSSDLNPIEHIWDKMKLLRRREKQLRNLYELGKALRQRLRFGTKFQ